MPEENDSTAINRQSSPPARSARRDQQLLAATEDARAAVEEVARPNSVGEHVGARMVGERLAAHRFKSLDLGYVGWEWEVSLARAPRSKVVTVCEINLVPGDGALLAPEWIPWEARLRPEDVTREDILPYSANDSRLISGFEQTDPDTSDTLGIEEIGMGRARVLSPEGIAEAAERWYASDRGPVAGMRGKATCSTCGFLLKMQGSLGQVFGICANEWAQDDGMVVSLDHTCGAHSETDETRRKAQWPISRPRVDDYEIYIFSEDE